MKSKILLILAFICVFFMGTMVGFLVWHSPEPTVGKSTIYSKGKEIKELKKGSEDVSIITMSGSGSDTKRALEVQDSSQTGGDSSVVSFSFSGSDSARYSLQHVVTTYPGVDSVKLTYKLTFDRVEKTRVDTLFITRVDTLTYTQVVEKPRPFYDNFWTGAASTAIAFAAVAILL